MLQRLRAVEDARCHAQSGALLAYSGRGMRFQPRPSTQEYQLGTRRVRPEQARRALLSSASAALRFPQPPARGKSSMRAGKDSDRGQRAYAPPRRGARSEGVAGLQDSAQTRRSSGRRALRGSTAQRRAFSRGQPRSREARAISASATMHLARATGSFGPKARAAFRRSSFARAKSPSCAIAMPRSASAGASSRSATRFNAPRGSPAASARAAPVIRESIRIPTHLSLPPLRLPALNIAHGN